MTDTLIKVEGVSKKFCRSMKRSLWYGVKDLGGELLANSKRKNGGLRQDEFWAVKDISFELKRGECLGLIGHNGAGKTTLLRMLNGLIKLDEGRIELRGRIGALISLGAGFNPILTGRENVYVNASILGLSKKEVDQKIDEIIDFSEIGEFIDAPVQSYSSGMIVRLGFAIAAILLDPDILFLDEVLAVGDIGFTIKCLNFVRRITNNAAVIFVSHNMQFVSLFCNRVLVLDHGKALLDTLKVHEGIDHYYRMVKHNRQTSGAGSASLLALHLMVDGKVLQEDEPSIRQGTTASVILEFEISLISSAAQLLVQINDIAMSPLVTIPVCCSDGTLRHFNTGIHRIELPLGQMDFNAGKYSFVVGIRESSSSSVLVREQGICPFMVMAVSSYWGKIVRPAILNDDLE